MNIAMPWCAYCSPPYGLLAQLYRWWRMPSECWNFCWDEREYKNIVLVQLRSFPQRLGESRSPMLMNAFWK